MKRFVRLLSVVCVLAMLGTTLAVLVSAEGYQYETPVEPSNWEENDFDTDYAYSFAFVGDTQYICCGDYYTGTQKMQQIYKSIADTAEERKLEHVFVLGDITDLGYQNDGNLGSKHNYPPITGEWEIAQKAISQLDGVVPYSLCRGNHDDYLIDHYFNVSAYTDTFKDCGGFFADLESIYPQRREYFNADRCLYWNALSGCRKDTIVNSWKTVEFYGTKYLFITIDYNPTQPVLDWVDETLAKFPDHRAIITTHSYMDDSGNLVKTESGNTMFPFELNGKYMWDTVFSKHENVFMIACGHWGSNDIVYNYNTGEKGNKVLQILVDPQDYDTKEVDTDGTVTHGKQDTGLVLYMNFSEDGNTITFDYYSTLLDKFEGNNAFTIHMDDSVDEEGSIDMADLANFGQETPLVTEKKTPSLDGKVTEGEYSATKVTAQNKIASGTIQSDLTEYYAYDDNYLYYAFTVKAPLDAYKLDLHLGSSLYTVKELNGDIHDNYLRLQLKFPECKCVLNVNGGSTPKMAIDTMCKPLYDAATGMSTYEFKVSRKYLADNNSPDNLLSYSLDFGNAVHNFPLNEEAQKYLADRGVESEYICTYNYAYFGSRPETTPEICEHESTSLPETESETEPRTQTETESLPDTSEQVTEPAPSKTGCKSAVSFGVAVLLPLLGAATVLCKKKR